MLALNEAEFDQNPAEGWRKVDSAPGCHLAAADLIETYRQEHPSHSRNLYWHEGQLRAFAGENEDAIALMENSRAPAMEDLIGWNSYIDATIAFLEKNKQLLLKARNELANTAPGKDLPQPKNGFIELPDANGQTMKLPWPPNLDVVDGLIHCFDKSYKEAYNSSCRKLP